MNTFVLVPLQESLVQPGACKHDQWRGYMTVIVINHGIIKLISILAVINRLMMKFYVDKLRDCFRREVKWMVAICYQFSTLSALNLDRIHHLPHILLQEKDTYFLPEKNQGIANALQRIQSGGDHNDRQCCFWLIE
jgi:hypothetical protein